MVYRSYIFRLGTIFILLLCLITRIHAQLGIGGIPPSFKYPQTRSSISDIHDIYVPFSIDDLLSDDLLNEQDGNPPRIAILLPAGLSISNNGIWKTLPGGEKIWQIHISANNALAIALYYNKFYIPEGGKLYIYNAQHTQILGAFDHYTNPKGGKFVTEFVAGEEVILEYVASDEQSSSDKPCIEIEEIGYGYNHLEIREDNDNTENISGSCMVDINCEEGQEWQDEKKGVCKMIMKIGTGSYLCTGSVINNTSGKLYPYILTAHHCLVASKETATNEELEQFLFYFNYERIRCGEKHQTKPKTITGCRLLAASILSGGVDEALLELSKDIPDSLNIYYNGWDRSPTPAQSGVCIHHPQGDVKKISTFTNPANSDTWRTKENVALENGHWNVQFSETVNGHGVTEKGSSGSPLFNQNGLIVGTLTGGTSSCTNPNGRNLFGKLHYFWDMCGKEDNERLDIWLDPNKTGVSQLQGRYATEPKPIPTGLSASWDAIKETISLQWSKPESEEIPVKYIILRNGYPIGSTTNLFFSEKKLPIGKYLYSIIGVYSDGKSSEASAPVAVSVYNYPIPTPPKIVRSGNKELSLSWENPLSEQQIFWGTMKPSVFCRTVEYKPFYFGQCWDEKEINSIDNFVIHSISFFPAQGAKYSLLIKQGINSYTQKIESFQLNTINEIILNTPFIIDKDNGQLIIAIKAESYLSEHGPACCDNGPAVNGKGNLLSLDGENWTAIYDNDPKSDFNFLVAANISSSLVPENNFQTPTASNYQGKNSSEAIKTIITEKIALKKQSENLTIYSSIPVGIPPTTWNVYRNGQLVNTNPIHSLSFTDSGLQPGEYSYKIEALYENQTIIKESPEISFRLSEKNWDADILSLEVSYVEESWSPEDLSKTEWSHGLPCHTENVVISIKTSPGATSEINGEVGTNYHFTFGKNSGKYPISIKITSEDKSHTKSYTLNLLKLSEYSIMQRWDNILSLVTNPNNNGGLNFISYQWFCNNDIMPGKTQPYISIIPNKLENAYHIEVVTTEGITLRSCESNILPITSNVTITPTLIKQGDILKIHIDQEEDLSQCRISIINTLGIIIKDFIPTISDTNLPFSWNAGNYIVRVITPSNKIHETKIICTP